MGAAEKLAVTLTLDSVALGTETIVSEFISKQTELLQIPHKTANRMQVAADEIYSNIVRYSGAHAASVSCRRQGDITELVFEDDGVPYDPTQTAEPDTTLSAEERQIGGLGILMVRRMAKSMEYSRTDGKNVLAITFAAK